MLTGPHRLADLGDRLSGSDPGAARLLTALRTVVSLSAVVGAEAAFVHLTGALDISPGPGLTTAQAVAHNHLLLVVAMLLNGTLALVTGFAISDATAGGQLLSLVLAPCFVIVALTVGLSIGGHRAWALASFPVLLAVGGYCRKFGPRGFVSGVLLFIGDFIGFLLHGVVALGDLGWVAAEIGTATVALVVVRFVLFRPDRSATVRRLQRSYQARASRVADLAIAVLDDPTPATRRQLSRQLGRLNEVALLIDAQLESDAGLLHQRLFDIELALTNMARFAEAMALGGLSTTSLLAVRRVLLAVRSGELISAQRAASDLLQDIRDPTSATSPPAGVPATSPPAGIPAAFSPVIPHRFATSVSVYAEAMGEWISLGRRGTYRAEPFTSVVEIRSGWLPGSAPASAAAATGVGGGNGRVRLPINVRSAVQMAVAVAGAVVIGDAISPRRFYWAVLAAFLAFVGTNHVAEQVRKAVNRVIGTVVGIAIGSAAVRLIGHDTALSLLVILVALFFGVYLFRISYAFMVVAITIAISQVYVQLDEYSTSLLLTRLAETAVGSGVALIVVAFVFPLRTSDVFGVAATRELRALAHLSEDAVERVGHPETTRPLRADARELDAAHQALMSTAAPMRWAVLGDLNQGIGTILAAASAARNYGRNLVADVEAAGTLDELSRTDLRRAGDTMATSIAALVAASEGRPAGPYVRSAALFDQVDRNLESTSSADPRRLVLRDLTLMDGALARMAASWRVPVEGLDTGAESEDGNARIPSTP